MLLVTVEITVAAARPEDATRSRYVKHTFGKTALARASAGAAVQQLRNSPREWGSGAAGFGKRVGSALGGHIIKGTIEFAVAGVRHEELGYRPSGQRRFKSRLKYALLSTVVTHKTTTGRRTVAAGRISGALGSGLASRLWQPARLRTVSSGVASGGIMLGADAGTNVVREFWPEIRHPHRH
jgi:hypothetical protein